MRQEYRHELKYPISFYQYQELKSIIAALMKKDQNGVDSGGYAIRSLYFDDLYNSAYTQKEDGIGVRKKYRIRIYNYMDHSIKLECKHKNDSYIFKESIGLTRYEYQKLMDNDIGFMINKDSPLAKEFYIDYRNRVLKPRVIVDYKREAYIDPVGQVRITFDKNIRAGYPKEDIFDENIPTFSVLDKDSMILEVKFTRLLPEKIRKIFRVKNYTQTSGSKFWICADKLSNIII